MNNTCGLSKILYDANDEEKDINMYKMLIPYFQARSSFAQNNANSTNYNLNNKVENKLPAEYQNLSANAKKAFRQLFYGQANHVQANHVQANHVQNGQTNHGPNMDIDDPNIDEYDTNDQNAENNHVPNTHMDKYEIDLYNPELNYLTNDEFIKLYNFLDFICYVRREFHPIFIRYLYARRADNAFMRQTARIHKRVDFIFLDFHSKSEQEKVLLHIKLWLLILGIDTYCNLNQNIDTYEEQLKIRAEFKRKWDENQCADSLYMYAFCLLYGIGADKNNKTETDEKAEACRLYKFNWDENKHVCSLHHYACCLTKGIGGPKDETKACRLFKLNWDENRYYASVYEYARETKIDNDNWGGSKFAIEARNLLKLNWDENRSAASLYAYANLLRLGIGCPKDQAEARRLCKLNWDENKHVGSLYCYVHQLHHGIGGPIDKTEAFRLLKLNWEKNKNEESFIKYYSYLLTYHHDTYGEEIRNAFKNRWEQYRCPTSLYYYAYCLENGIGGPKDQTEAFRLYKLNCEENKHEQSSVRYEYLRIEHLYQNKRRGLCIIS